MKQMKCRLAVLFVALLMLFSVTACTYGYGDMGIIGGADGPTAIIVGKADETLDIGEVIESADHVEICYASPIAEDGYYYSKDDVSLYIYTYDELPDNYITKDEAQELGWEGGSVEVYLDGAAIGGDVFGNREGLLPKKSGRVYYECDIDTNGAKSRGAKRIVYSNDGLIFYTDDHYDSFTQLYFEEE